MYLFFDTETTGLPLFKEPPEAPGQPHIMQLGAKLTTADFQIVAYLDTLIKPSSDWKPHPKALETHGITVERCEMEGLPIEAVMLMFEVMARLADVVVAHNVQFDRKLMESEAARLRPPNTLPELRYFCTMQALTPVIRLPGKFGGFKWPKLVEAHEWAFGEGFEGAHSAMVDVDALIRVFRHMVEKDLVEVER